jgi:hypothetical protein
MGGVDWIGLAQDMDRWRALVNAAIDSGYHKLMGSFRVAEKLVAVRKTGQSSSAPASPSKTSSRAWGGAVRHCSASCREFGCTGARARFARLVSESTRTEA